MDIALMDAGEVVACVDAFVAIYGAAFAALPYSRGPADAEAFGSALAVHTLRRGFRCVVARQESGGPTVGPLVGFAYGHRSLRGQWWHDNVARSLGSCSAGLWLADAFQVTEVAVHPEHQGHGVGGALHDLLLAGVDCGHAVLSTLDAETPGYFLYLNRGWQDLLRGFHFPGVARPYRIMGRLLS